ncbi:unnamed protein product [Rhizophagus irregularis]|uniref:Protein kinase domain-containing protein n=1 Tax=Rhizophagus irregularis TaxID=588596 RepID=A0A915Z2E2_9GLOM|nr:unnamed protein product [Rhizophagus irregularis]
MRDSKNTNEWINWIEEAIVKEHLKLYEYNQFSNIQEIGSGVFGKVYRANWKILKKQFVLKSFFNLNNVTIKEIVCELKNQRKVDFLDNIIRCHGITKFESDQIAYAVSCLHSEGIIHRDLHSDNILVHQNMIKLADFGLGQPPFYVENEEYDVGLAVEISQGLRETVVPDTPEEYVKIYTKCWDGEPDNRPTIYQGKLIKERAIENFNNYNNDYYNNDDYNQDVILCDSSRVDTYNSNSITYRNIGNYLKNLCEIIEHQEINIVSIHPTINNRFEIFCLKLEQIDLFRSLMYKYYESGCESTGTWDEPLPLNTRYLCDPAYKEYLEFFDEYKEITLYFTEGLERVNSDEYRNALAYFKYAIDLENDWISDLFVTDSDKKCELVKLNGEKLRRSKEIDSYAKACLKVEHDDLLRKIRHEPYRTRGLKDGLQILPYIVAYIGASNCAKDELFKRFRDEFEELIERIDFTEEQQTLIHILLKKYTQPEESLELKPSDEVEPDEYLCERYETALKRCSSGLKSYEVPYI